MIEKPNKAMLKLHALQSLAFLQGIDLTNALLQAQQEDAHAVVPSHTLGHTVVFDQSKAKECLLLDPWMPVSQYYTAVVVCVTWHNGVHVAYKYRSNMYSF